MPTNKRKTPLITVKGSYWSIRAKSLRGAIRTRTQKGGGGLRGLEADGAYLANLRLPKGTDMSHAQLTRAVMPHVRAKSLVLSGADLSHASLCGSELPYVLWMGSLLDHADLGHGNYPVAKAGATNFTRATLSHATLRLGKFFECSFAGAYAVRVNFTGSSFIRCEFDQADLIGANFRSCKFDNCSFRGACVEQACFSGITGDVDLSETYGQPLGLAASAPRLPASRRRLLK